METGEERGAGRVRRKAILMFGDEWVGAANESVIAKLEAVKDLDPLKRMIRRAATAANWQEILDTP